VSGGWRRLHIEELPNLCFTPNVIRLIRLRGMEFAWHVARMGEMRNSYTILVGKAKVRYHLEESVNGKAILERILGK
jgi:hypothetical protein